MSTLELNQSFYLCGEIDTELSFERNEKKNIKNNRGDEGCVWIPPLLYIYMQAGSPFFWGVLIYNSKVEIYQKSLQTPPVVYWVTIVVRYGRSHVGAKRRQSALIDPIELEFQLPSLLVK